MSPAERAREHACRALTRTEPRERSGEGFASLPLMARTAIPATMGYFRFVYVTSMNLISSSPAPSNFM